MTSKEIWHLNTFPIRSRIVYSEREREKVIRNFRQKFSVSENTQNHFSVNSAICGIFMNSFMWASVCLDQERDQFQCVLRNMDVEVIQQIQHDAKSDPQLAERRSVGPAEVAGLGSESFGTLRHIQTIGCKGVCLFGFCAVSWWKMPTISRISTEVWAEDRI